MHQVLALTFFQCIMPLVKIFLILSCVNAMLSYLDQVNSFSWTNQGPQQWDQSGPVNNGQSPHSTVPQDQYTQMDQQGQFQNGTVLTYS